MKFYAKIIGPNEIQLTSERRSGPDGASFYQRSEGWYEIERELDIEAGEYLEHDEQNDCIVIKKREKSTEELEVERKIAVKRQLIAELPDIILQNKDDPAALAQALCDRAKQIETETTNDHERNPKAV